MRKYRYYLVLAIVILGVGCYLLVNGPAAKPEEWPMMLGAICVIVAVFLAAIIESLHALHKRVEALEQMRSPVEAEVTR